MTVSSFQVAIQIPTWGGFPGTGNTMFRNRTGVWSILPHFPLNPSAEMTLLVNRHHDQTTDCTDNTDKAENCWNS